MRRQVHPLNHIFHLKLQDGKFFRSQLNTHVTGGFVATVRGAAGTGGGRLCSACQLSRAPCRASGVQVLLLHVCEQVHLYGFNTDESISQLGTRAIKARGGRKGGA